MTTPHGTIADLTVIDMPEDKLTFKIDTPGTLSITWRPPEYECPVHGNIKDAHIEFILGDKPVDGKLCLQCLVEQLKGLGVCTVTEIKK